MSLSIDMIQGIRGWQEKGLPEPVRRKSGCTSRIRHSWSLQLLSVYFPSAVLDVSVSAMYAALVFHAFFFSQKRGIVAAYSHAAPVPADLTGKFEQAMRELLTAYGRKATG